MIYSLRCLIGHDVPLNQVTSLIHVLYYKYINSKQTVSINSNILCLLIDLLIDLVTDCLLIDLFIIY